jgi:hypothetical protein
MAIWYTFPRFGIKCQDKSGNLYQIVQIGITSDCRSGAYLKGLTILRDLRRSIKEEEDDLCKHKALIDHLLHDSNKYNYETGPQKSFRQTGEA